MLDHTEVGRADDVLFALRDSGHLTLEVDQGDAEMIWRLGPVVFCVSCQTDTTCHVFDAEGAAVAWCAEARAEWSRGDIMRLFAQVVRAAVPLRTLPDHHSFREFHDKIPF